MQGGAHVQEATTDRKLLAMVDNLRDEIMEHPRMPNDTKTEVFTSLEEIEQAIHMMNDGQESAVQEDESDEDKIKQWAEKYRQYKNLEDDNLVKALYDFAFDLGITQFIFEIGELQAAEEKLGKKQEDWEDTEINAAMEMSPISNGLLDDLHRILPGNAELEQKLDSIRDMLEKAGLKVVVCKSVK